MVYGIHVGSHICLGGVTYTLGVNDRGRHLCLGAIYASDTGVRGETFAICGSPVHGGHISRGCSMPRLVSASAPGDPDMPSIPRLDSRVCH